uniref:Uncharacterized protein n=1 Tax=Arundo donax TaxID=35708 RepID=A0A0A9HLE4_ARUDO
MSPTSRRMRMWRASGIW